MENLFIMKKLKKYSNYLKEVVRKMREKNRIEKIGRNLTSGSLKIIIVRKDPVLFAYTKERSLVKKEDYTVPWYMIYTHVKAIEKVYDTPIELENGLKESIDYAVRLAKKYPQLAPLELVEIDPEDII